MAEFDDRGILQSSRRRLAIRSCPTVFALLCAAALAGCQADRIITGSVGPKARVSATNTPATEAQKTAAVQRQLAAAARKYQRRPGNKANAIAYAYLLRRAGQPGEALGVLQNATVKHPGDRNVAIAYAKALADTGKTKDALNILKRAESASQADWDYMSTAGAMHDQIGDHETARAYYKKALALSPNEPRVLSNLGLNYALTRDLDEAEKLLRHAATLPGSDNRVRQNLALVLGLQGKFTEAETVARKDLPPAEAAQNLAVLRRMLSQDNTWDKVKKAG